MRPLVVSKSRMRCASGRVRLATLDDVSENDRFEVLCLGCSLLVRVVLRFFVLFVCFQLSVTSMLPFGFSPFRLDDRVMMLIVLQFPCVCTCVSCCP